MLADEETFKKDVLSRIPLRDEPPLPPDWLHIEMLERFRVLRFASIKPGMNVLEIGCGAHALTTVPLAYLVGETGRVVAVDRARWRFFEEIASVAGLKHRIIPLKIDAKKLPFPFKAFDLAVLVHGVRSLRNEETMVRVFSEMLRVAEVVFIAESLPIASNERQRAHLELYNLRKGIFEALFGGKDDLHYLPLERLKELVETAGGEIIESGTFEPSLPHYLAYIPREYVEQIKDGKKRAELLGWWDRAYEKWKAGAEHPPAGWLIAEVMG
ncbi:methyltransferase domain-containing protein [Thermococcus sp. GR7]|uniref:class I SAM-dependent methyltransferase n=1 Tax=unclassified Thermococcus TaxID=2627626 RepID=UPI001430662B|nr:MULTISPECIES: methyltransferase domain-containing protein [unclassified Thermococcus]NJE47041.1 methyltransferase domain-containing protein [Thermococcus sp. GR7]NJE78134.1 methyltransferase domain-containing protein [Thermococcus sp. GR4]NJF22749.1 methyltransferase domain-containing protein [Thermococcus sp. GR5]